MNWEIIITVISTLGGFEGLKWWMNRKTNARMLDIKADSDEFHLLRERLDTADKHLLEKEKLLYEKEQQKSLSAVLKSAQGNQYSVVTGPEGGVSEKEAQLAQEAGLSCVSIGPRILRCETAPVAALCAIMYETGNFDIGE